MVVFARIVAVSVLALMGVMAVAGCQDADDGPVLPVGASPQAVVSAYIDAINAHDSAAGRKLSTPSFAERQESLFDDAKFSHVRIGAPRPERDYAAPDDGSYREAVYVPVEFVLRHSDEGSMPNGPTVWGYTLVRADAGRPWRIIDNGVG
ncbi:hypothetical protein HS041_07145 [Planomonospora sp. ID67723]|uniref:hypothetical protein n=1 Tax=Planomonospora sp. ID67723 TaxID=2738134 RepID=UPI0018C3C00F|nr:hypothetical protein [Planomonospora sp. ID67723]MBG0827537.1 hypothetical protein [Planomonospora sp. ID67723]